MFLPPSSKFAPLPQRWQLPLTHRRSVVALLLVQLAWETSTSDSQSLATWYRLYYSLYTNKIWDLIKTNQTQPNQPTQSDPAEPTNQPNPQPSCLGLISHVFNGKCVAKAQVTTQIQDQVWDSFHPDLSTAVVIIPKLAIEDDKWLQMHHLKGWKWTRVYVMEKKCGEHSDLMDTFCESSWS